MTEKTATTVTKRTGAAAGEMRKRNAGKLDFNPQELAAIRNALCQYSKQVKEANWPELAIISQEETVAVVGDALSKVLAHPHFSGK